MFMKYPEEDIARELYREMVRRFPSFSPMIDGAGVHWHSGVDLEDRACRINCFTLPKGREYYTSYQYRTKSVAYSRIPSGDETLEAVSDWLNGADLASLYDRYWFVDATKRHLIHIRDQAIAAEPDLEESTEVELVQQIDDIYYLFFRSSDRACKISFYGKNQWPDAKFSWDECVLFEYRADDSAQLAAVLRRWLCDTAVPSVMRNEFPWLAIGELADYYENGNPIEGEFIKSWDSMEEFYRELDFPVKKQVAALMAAMRERGYDRKFRAGQSLLSLILSRSRRHGLRSGQRSIQFWFMEEGMEILVDGAGMVNVHTGDHVYRQKKTCPQIELTPEIIDLIDQLVQEPIN
jgi:hypothetical protein